MEGVAMNILLIDDDILILTVLKMAFEKWGHNVVAYDNPINCHAFCSTECPCPIIKNGCPDVILTDVKMPQVNGIRFVEELIRKGCKCPKIGMMSGDWSDSDLLRAVCMGATVFAKPFDLSRLRSWVSEEKILHDLRGRCA